MICAGREFDDGSLSWDDLHAFIFAAPPGTAVFHAIEKGWSTGDHLLANLIDVLLIANWQRTADATRKDPKNLPGRFPRPGDEAETPSGTKAVQVGSAATATVTTVGKFLEMRAEREKRWRRRHTKAR
jgi:hypothetical protein